LSFRILLFSNSTFFGSGLRADGSFRMTNDSLDYLWNPEAPADWFVKFPLKECADLFGLPYTGVIDRPDLQEILIDECRAINPNFLVNGNPVTGYENMGKGDGVTVNLEDGSRVDADILVGADGIWSAVRSQMYNEGGVKSTSPDKKMRQGCTYSGYTVFAGETVLKTDDYYETGYKVYIGPQRYFVTSDVGDGRIQWYAFFALPPGSKKAPSGWGGSEREGQDDPEENLVEYVKSLHEGWSSEVMTVLDATPPDSVEQRDLYDRAPEFLRSWADGNVVLMGGEFAFCIFRYPVLRLSTFSLSILSFRCYSCYDAESWTGWMSSHRRCLRSHRNSCEDQDHGEDRGWAPGVLQKAYSESQCRSVLVEIS
jgi:zeaxanthin epoxidase